MARDGLILAITASVISSLLSVLDGIMLEIITPFWYIAIHYGMNPQYSFYGIVGSAIPYPSFYSILFGSSYFIIFDLAVTLAALVFLAMNTFSNAERTSRLALRIALATLLPIFAFQIVSLFMYSSGYLFAILWNNLGVNWNTGLTNLNSISSFESAVSGSNPYLDVMEFFFLSGYFLATAALIVTLELRQAVLIVLTVLLPAVSVLFAFPGLNDYAKRLWKLFFETAMFPFITLVALYFAVRVQSNFPLQIGFLILAGSSPLLIVSAFRVFSAGSTLGIVSGLSLERTTERAGSLVEGASMAAGYLGQGSSTIGNSRQGGYANSPINWDDLYKREFDYRRNA